ncbi:MAG TPA: DUF2461 domain-containing protein [Gemmatimonadaceae bacterium]|nr:DUF2461 domain-containing protein [Gemmatimonadaceae bacterium]
MSAARKGGARGVTSVQQEEFSGFPTAAFTFLKQLADNNERDWFEARRETYEQSLRVPMRALIEEMDARLATFAPEIIGTVKGSMFRIHRDVRFSKDKSPYKTNAACWFFHRDSRGTVGQDAVHGGAGLYFQLEPRACFAGGGVWMPPAPVLKRVRTALDVGHEEFESIVSAKAFRKTFGALDTEAMLKRMPRGFDAEHPAATWLRHQSFTAGCALTQSEVTSARLADRLEEIFRTITPLVRWLNTAMGFRPHTSR